MNGSEPSLRERFESEETLTAVEAAKFLGCGRTHLFQLIGEPNPAIPSYIFAGKRRIFRADLEEYRRRLIEGQHGARHQDTD